MKSADARPQNACVVPLSDFSRYYVYFVTQTVERIGGAEIKFESVTKASPSEVY